MGSKLYAKISFKWVVYGVAKDFDNKNGELGQGKHRPGSINPSERGSKQNQNEAGRGS